MPLSSVQAAAALAARASGSAGTSGSGSDAVTDSASHDGIVLTFLQMFSHSVCTLHTEHTPCLSVSLSSKGPRHVSRASRRLYRRSRSGSCVVCAGVIPPTDDRPAVQPDQQRRRGVAVFRAGAIQ